MDSMIFSPMQVIAATQQQIHRRVHRVGAGGDAQRLFSEFGSRRAARICGSSMRRPTLNAGVRLCRGDTRIRA